MSALVIPNLDDATLAQLRQHAAAHGRTLENEATAILTAALQAASDRIAEIAAGLVQWRRLGKSDTWILDTFRELTAADLASASDYAAAHPEEIGQAIERARRAGDDVATVVRAIADLDAGRGIPYEEIRATGR